MCPLGRRTRILWTPPVPTVVVLMQMGPCTAAQRVGSIQSMWKVQRETKQLL